MSKMTYSTLGRFGADWAILSLRLHDSAICVRQRKEEKVSRETNAVAFPD